MTDEQDMDMHQDGHNDPVHEAPSDYEFADDHGAPIGDSATTDGQKTQRRSLLPILAAVGGLLALGAVGWWQFAGTSAIDTSFTPTPAPVAAMPAPVQPAPSQPATAGAGSALPAPVIPALPETSVVSPTAASAVASALPTAPLSDITPTLKPTDAMNAAPVALIPATPNSGDQNLQTLNGRIDTLQKQMERTNSQLSQMTNMIAANASTGTAPAPNKDVENRLTAIEQQLSDLRHKHDRVSASPVTTANEEVPQVLHHAAIHKKMVTAKSHKALKMVMAKPLPKPQTKFLTKPATKGNVKWVLRAATPDGAWVADSATSRDLKQLKVGDSLPSIGRITAISQNGDDWVVQGTKGKIQ